MRYMSYLAKEQFLNDCETEIKSCNNISQVNNLILEQIYPAIMKLNYEDRAEITELITELTFELFESFPNKLSLQLLADILLADYVKNKVKTKDTENQFHTYNQEKRRKRKEFSAVDDTLNFIYSKDVLKMDSLAKKYTEEFD